MLRIDIFQPDLKNTFLKIYIDIKIKILTRHNIMEMIHDLVTYVKVREW